ncbi:C-terminal binding protein [Senegalia massiliensis]|uniref:C-terminal binding protein n=1 Tax=Senegalia massiliensis TaxID=1720316 RepID=A0A845R250_9CLOT|nr:C-terminal binding protein [Senegalia massiliensis]NBI07786.1 C-terminal binding protein [Senegalia massiliensis]
MFNIKKVVFLGVPGMNPKDITNMEKYIKEEYENVDYEFLSENVIPKDELIEKCKDIDVLISWDQKMDDEIYEKLKLRAYCAASTGYNAANVDAATRNNVIVTNVSGYCTEEVATHTIMLILSLYRKTYKMIPYVKEGNWDLEILGKIKRFENSTVGLYGFGKIPQAVAKKLSGFGVRIISSDPFVTKEDMNEFNVEKVETDTLLKESDYLSLHAPLVDSTKYFIRKENIKKMKNTAYIINTARGALINSEDLYNSLKNGEILGAGLDVLEVEPPGELEKKIINLKNTIVTAHSAYLSEEAADQQIKTTAKIVGQILRGERPMNVINPKVLDNIQ